MIRCATVSLIGLALTFGAAPSDQDVAESAFQSALEEAFPSGAEASEYTLRGLLTSRDGLTAPGAPERMRALFDARSNQAFLVSGWPGGALVVTAQAASKDARALTAADLDPERLLALDRSDFAVGAAIWRGPQILVFQHGRESSHGITEWVADDGRAQDLLTLTLPASLLAKRNWLDTRPLAELVTSAELIERREAVEPESGLTCQFRRYKGSFGELELWVAPGDPARLVRMRMTKGADDPFRGKPVSQTRPLQRYLPELTLQSVSYDIGATHWRLVGTVPIPTRGYSRLEYRHDDGETVIWSSATFTVERVEAASSRSLADQLVAGLDDGAQVTRANQDFGGVMFEWREGEIVPAANETALKNLEEAIADASGLGAGRTGVILWSAAGVIVVLAAIGAFVIYRRRTRLSS